jgi:hypothetical protein
MAQWYLFVVGSSASYTRGWYWRNRDAVLEQIRYRRRTDPVSAIYADTRRADRKKGRANDLDHEFIRSLILQPCAYCGEREHRRSLDRVDNSRGHTKDNVQVACERCNYVRRDMPFDAWLIVAAGMRAAREANLFGDWNGGIHHRRLVTKVVVKNRQPQPHGTLAGYKKCGPPRCELCKAAMASWKRGRRSLKNF